MYKMEFVLGSQDNAAQILADTIGRNMGSLRGTKEAWEGLIAALRAQFKGDSNRGWMGVADAAYDLIQSAVPEIGSPDPRRAEFICDGRDRNCLRIATPGGEVVCLLLDYEGFNVHIAFGRDSRYLSTCIAAELFRCGVHGSADLLAQAASMAASAQQRVR